MNGSEDTGRGTLAEVGHNFELDDDFNPNSRRRDDTYGDESDSDSETHTQEFGGRKSKPKRRKGNDPSQVSVSEMISDTHNKEFYVEENERSEDDENSYGSPSQFGSLSMSQTDFRQGEELYN